MTDEIFMAYERLETCQRVEVTLDNLHLLAQHFGGSAVYTADPEGDWVSKKPHLIIPRKASGLGRIEVGAWVDQKGSRWNPEPLTQGWEPSGTFQRTNTED